MHVLVRRASLRKLCAQHANDSPSTRRDHVVLFVWYLEDDFIAKMKDEE